MAKVDEWRKKVDDWKKILGQPKNLGLRSTGLSEAILKVGDAEMDFALAKAPGKEIVSAYNDLNKNLSDLIDLCKKLSDKHKKVFTTACNFVDGVKAEATTRRSEAAREVDQARGAVGELCAAARKHLTEAKNINEFATHWQTFAAGFETAGKGFPTLKAAIAKVKEQAAPTGALDQARPAYLKLVQASQNATQVR